MKLTYTRTLFLLAVVIGCYTACKKSPLKPITTATTPTDYKALSSNIARQFYKSITGQYGGTDVSQGITLSSKFNFAAHKGLTINSITPLCGFVVDTTYNYTIGADPIKDTVKTFFGNFHFTYTCDANQVNGYIVRDSLVNKQIHALYINDIFMVSQNYTVKALDQTYKLVSMDGSIRSLIGTGNGEALTSHSLASTYILSGLRVNFTSGTADITSGIVTFHTTLADVAVFSYINNIINYDGTIEFLGNHKARLTINPGMVYIVDLITGVVTPA